MLNFADFPPKGKEGIEYKDSDTGKIYKWNGAYYVHIKTLEETLSGNSGYIGDEGSQMKNKSIEHSKTWNEDGLMFTELIRQEYTGNNCVISAGFVEGENKPPVDTTYLKLEKDETEPTVLLLRPDELQAIAWVSSGAIWSHLMCEKESIRSRMVMNK